MERFRKTMIAEAGHFALILGLVIALVQGTFPLFGLLEVIMA